MLLHIFHILDQASVVRDVPFTGVQPEAPNPSVHTCLEALVQPFSISEDWSQGPNVLSWRMFVPFCEALLFSPHH